MSNRAIIIPNKQTTHSEQTDKSEGPIQEATDKNEGLIQEAIVMSGEDSSDELIVITYGITSKTDSPISEITINEPSFQSIRRL